MEESNNDQQKLALANIDREEVNPVQTQKSISNENDTQPQGMLKTQEALNTTLENVKEKQCWDTFCKMNKKGVNISFDTILRGMLTPTEYRLRRKSIATFADSNTENINDT